MPEALHSTHEPWATSLPPPARLMWKDEATVPRPQNARPALGLSTSPRPPPRKQLGLNLLSETWAYDPPRGVRAGRGAFTLVKEHSNTKGTHLLPGAISQGLQGVAQRTPSAHLVQRGSTDTSPLTPWVSTPSSLGSQLGAQIQAQVPNTQLSPS